MLKLHDFSELARLGWGVAAVAVRSEQKPVAENHCNSDTESTQCIPRVGEQDEGSADASSA